jgi:hypothetical protein
VAELRVGIDVSPPELTGAGTAPYLRNLLDQTFSAAPATGDRSASACRSSSPSTT